MIVMVFLILIAILLEGRLRTDIVDAQPSWWIMFGIVSFIGILSYIFGFNKWYPVVQTSIIEFRKILCKRLY